jgi:hypothetical protein
LKRGSTARCSAASGSASAIARRIAAAASSVTVICGGVRSGAGTPRASCSSPLLSICSMMSLPPSSSPSTYSCGIVGHWP